LKVSLWIFLCWSGWLIDCSVFTRSSKHVF
jgi:hypothetical protein